MPALTRSQAIIQYANDLWKEIRSQPVRLQDIRSRAQALEEFAEDHIYKRSTLGLVCGLIKLHYPLPELIAFYRREQEVYYEHVRKGDFDLSSEKNMLIEGIYGLCDWWLDPHHRYPYGDVRLLRPLLGEVLIAGAEWDHCPYPDEFAQLGQWYEELAPDGPLHPSKEHLAYVARFEDFAEDILWDSRGQECITIVNFPAPPNALPPVDHHCTQHVLRPGTSRSRRGA